MLAKAWGRPPWELLSTERDVDIFEKMRWVARARELHNQLVYGTGRGYA